MRKNSDYGFFQYMTLKEDVLCVIKRVFRRRTKQSSEEEIEREANRLVDAVWAYIHDGKTYEEVSERYDVPHSTVHDYVQKVKLFVELVESRHYLSRYG